MMRNTITRTLTTSVIKGFKLTMKEGQPIVEELTPIYAQGKLNEKQALKQLHKAYGKSSSITVGTVEEVNDTYEITVEDFMKYAKKVEKETTTEEQATAE